MKNWKVKDKQDIKQEEWMKKYHPLILSMLRERRITAKEEIENFFDFDYEKNILNPFGLADMDKAVERITLAKDKQEKIAIFGDYDADGVTATVLIFETLKDLGFRNLTYYIPDRQLEGYGMNSEAVNFLKKEGVSLIITVDCGSTNFSEAAEAKRLGIDVIITDHHHVPERRPEALALINSERSDSKYKSKKLAGVGVAFKLAQALYQKISPQKVEQLKWALDLVAVGTVADCVPLLGENRILVKFGLVVLSKTRRSGLQEMFKVGRISISENEKPDTHKVAFQIAPRINAAGRMDHASVSFNLIMEKDPVKARLLALEVESRNQERQKLTTEIVREIRILAENSFKNRKFIFAQSPHWPVGILGLIAGRIADEFQKPTIILQDQGLEMVGSLRSIPEVDIVEALEECSELLIKFGGHAQAAGITVSKNKADEFLEKMSRIVEEKLKNIELEAVLEIDAEIKPENIDWDFIGELKKMEPFGQGNVQPVFFMKSMVIEDLRMVGNGSKHLKLSLRGKAGSPKIFDAIGFSMGEKFPNLKAGDTIDIVFNLEEDEWNGNKKIQLKLIDLKLT
jgi:single-stranded-DNA-specific exonuclease